jgi:DNA-binding HxlR family transcriptional regulator
MIVPIDIDNCTFNDAINVLNGKWKFSILFILFQTEKMRYKELERAVTGISSRMLVKELKDLEEKNIIRREAFATVPPTVEYSLTPCGRSLKPIMESLSAWGKIYQEQQKNIGA